MGEHTRLVCVYWSARACVLVCYMFVDKSRFNVNIRIHKFVCIVIYIIVANIQLQLIVFLVFVMSFQIRQANF